MVVRRIQRQAETFAYRLAAPIPDIGTADAPAGNGGNLTDAVLNPNAYIPEYQDHGGAGPNTGANTGGSLLPTTQNLENTLKGDLPGNIDIGGYRPPDPDGKSEHSSGQALDVMTSDPATANKTITDAFKDPNTNYALWNGEQYNPDGTHGKMEDRGSVRDNHGDHVHLNVAPPKVSAIFDAARLALTAAALVVDPPTLECRHRTPCPPGACPQRDIAADPDFYADFPDPADKEREFQDLYRLQHDDAPAPTDPAPPPLVQPARDILTEFLHERGRRNRRPITITCPACKGYKTYTCPHCNDKRVIVKPETEAKLRPWAERLENALYNEFMEWWPQSEASRIRKPETSGTCWQERPKEPVTHWLNVEDFLKERYPEAATGANYGGEEAQGLLERAVQEQQMSPKWLEERGYVGHGNPVTQAMLTLHNRFNGRPQRNAEDRRRYYELMLRHVGPGAVKRPKVAAVNQDMIDRLHGEFTDWWGTHGPAHLEQSIAASGWPEKTLRSMAERAMTERGPVGYWPNVEGFLKAKYPASHKNLFMGYEEARTLLDWEKNHAPDHSPGGVSLYETGPQAEAVHGYDPKEIAAAMLLLHNKSDAHRNDRSDPMVRKMDISGQDIDRLNEIAQKRSEMQQAFEQRAAASNRTVSLSPSPDTDSTIYGLSSEFNDWAKANNKNNPYDDRYLAMPIEEYAKAVPRNWKPRGPVGYWPNIEEFMKEKYPAAHRGLSMGFEDADPLLDTVPEDLHNLDWLAGKDQGFEVT